MTPQIDPTPIADLDRAVGDLLKASERFAQSSIAERIALLESLIRETVDASDGLVQEACRLKGIAFDSALAAEEWLAGPMAMVLNMRQLKGTLEDIQRNGEPTLAPSRLRTRSDGQVVVDVFPLEVVDRVLFAGVRAEVRLDPALSRSEALARIAETYRGERPAGGVALVLGAGNVSSIGPMDVLYKLFVENRVCILKMNPVNEVLGPHLERGFKTAIDAGYLRVVYGAAEVGAHLVQHADVAEVHITGSETVHDIIVWGTGKAAAKRRKAGTPLLEKRITSELGCVTPIIVTPGEWTSKELTYQAESVATMMANNGSFNCNAAKVLVTSAHWAQRGVFLSQLRAVLARVQPRVGYYPGAAERHARFMEAYPDALTVGTPEPDALPWALASGLDPGDADQLAFGTEAWCAFLAETALDVAEPANFLTAAVEFCNTRLSGTLSCGVIIDPRTQRKPGVTEALDWAISELHYGSVAVNQWPAVSYALGVTAWGAYPGHTLEDIGSGIGSVHNSLMLPDPQKSVVWAPFVMQPTPPWFVTHRNAHRVGRSLTHFEAERRWLRLPSVLLHALRS